MAPIILSMEWWGAVWIHAIFRSRQYFSPKAFKFKQASAFFKFPVPTAI
jgi:hypothetical protein